MKLQIRVDENGRISDVKFKTFGCGSAIASSSYMTERVKGLTIDEASKIKNTEIAKELCLPPVKRIPPPLDTGSFLSVYGMC
jgi:iron-sulfur cluster assembly enzyme ISCU, mitochondrial